MNGANRKGLFRLVGTKATTSRAERHQHDDIGGGRTGTFEIFGTRRDNVTTANRNHITTSLRRRTTRSTSDKKIYHLLNYDPSSGEDRRRYNNNSSVLKAIRSDPSSTKIKYAFTSRSKCLRHITFTERLYPLFQAVGLPVSIDVVKKLHNLNPEAITQRSTTQVTVLHHACCFGADYKIIKYLIKQYPEACSIKKKHLYTPLYCSLESNFCSVKLAKLFVKANSGVLYMRTKLNETPKDIAIRKMRDQNRPDVVTINEENGISTPSRQGSRIEHIRRGNFNADPRRLFSHVVYDGAPKTRITQELVDILTPVDKRTDNKNDSPQEPKKSIRKMSDSFTSTRS